MNRVRGEGGRFNAGSVRNRSKRSKNIVNDSTNENHTNDMNSGMDAVSIEALTSNFYKKLEFSPLFLTLCFPTKNSILALHMSWCTRASIQSSQSPLSVLRKKTGYAISNCKKALEICQNDLAKAEAWLNAQAQQQGWDKAAKLQSRSTPNGLVGIQISSNKAAMVEVNCETDFVARNEKFQELVVKAANICFSAISSSLQKDAPLFNQKQYNSAELGKLSANQNDGGSDGTLSDVVALTIGQIGENMALRRGVTCFASDSNIKIACCTHPLLPHGETYLGKYGAIILYEEQQTSDSAQSQLPDGLTKEALPKQLCQHIIVGMNPLSIEKGDRSSSDDEERALLKQEFVANPSYLVEEILEQAGLRVVSFVRFECGEEIDQVSSKAP
nr:EOG090X0EI4 [Macrothrix elegans]